MWSRTLCRGWLLGAMLALLVAAPGFSDTIHESGRHIWPQAQMQLGPLRFQDLLLPCIAGTTAYCETCSPTNPCTGGGPGVHARCEGASAGWTCRDVGAGTGTVQTVDCVDGLLCTPDPITAAGIISLDINQLAVETTLADGDLFPFLDVSAGTDPNDQRKVTLANLRQAINPSTTTTTTVATTTTTTATTTTVTTTTATTTTTLPGVASPTNVILPYNTNSVFTGGTTTNAAMGANATLCGTFVPHFRLNPTKVAFRVQNTVALATCGCALYTVSGATLTITTVTTGAIACATPGLKSTTGLTPVTLNPGTKYAYCCSQSATTQSWLVSAAYSDSTAAEQIMNAYTTNLGSGTASVGGAPPASVTLSALGVQLPIVNFSEE